MNNGGNMKPACFDSEEQWTQYKHFCKAAKPVNFCADCTASHKMQMIRQKRCEHLDVVFVERTYKDRAFGNSTEKKGIRPGKTSKHRLRF